jgi:PAS domain S-box-containing protein
MESRSSIFPKPYHFVIGGLFFLGLVLSSRHSYLLFHSFAEAFSISVAVAVFMVAWNTRRDPGSGYFLFLGISCLFLAVMDLLHMLAYKGMGVFPGHDANLPTQLWIAMRYLMAFSFLIAPVFIGKKFNTRLVVGSYAAVVALLLASIFTWGIFPDCYLEGRGLTPFKKVSEFVIVGIFLASIAVIAWKRDRFDQEVLRLIVAAIALAALSDLMFSLYIDVYGLTNMAGHFIEILSMYVVYRAVVATDLVRKHEMLRSLEVSEERFRSVAQTANDAIVSIDEKGFITLWNTGAEKMFGYAADEIIGKPLSTIMPVRMREAHSLGLNRAAAMGKTNLSGKTIEITGLRKDGGEFPVELSMSNWKAGGKLFFTGILRDVTERKRGDKHIRHLASFPEMNPNPVLEMDFSGDVVYCNPAAQRILKELGMGLSDVSAFLPECLLEVLSNPAKQWGEVGYNGEVAIKDRVFEGTVSLFPVARIARMYMRDITSRKRAESELKAAKEKLETRVAERTAELTALTDRLEAELDHRLKTEEALRDSMTLLENIFSNIHLCVVYLDTEFNFIRVNRTYADSCGHPPEFFHGKNHFKLYPDAENEAIFRKVVETGQRYVVTAKPFVFPDHPERGITYWDWSLLPIADPDGKVTALIFCLVDVTERIMFEADRARSEELFRSLVAESPVGIFILRNGRIGYVNPEQGRLFGGIPEGFQFSELPDIHPEDKRKFDDFCRAIRSGEKGPLNIDFRFYPFGKSVELTDMRWVHCRATPMAAHGEGVHLAIMMDITRIKDMERQIMIREKLASLGHVAAGIAHEVRNPLSGINIYLTALQKILVEEDGMEPLTREEAGEVLLQIQSAAQRIESVIRKIMDFVRPSSPRKELVDVSVAVENAIDFTAMTLRRGGVSLDRSALASMPKCPADTDLITQVVMNLFTNAAQAMERNVSQRTIKVSSVVENGNIVIRVADSGPGVPKAIRDKVFEPFYTTRKDGYGIGLSFCRRVIEDHGGVLKVGQSRLGGAEFIIELPVAEDEGGA